MVVFIIECFHQSLKVDLPEFLVCSLILVSRNKEQSKTNSQLEGGLISEVVFITMFVTDFTSSF